MYDFGLFHWWWVAALGCWLPKAAVQNISISEANIQNSTFPDITLDFNTTRRRKISEKHDMQIYRHANKQHGIGKHIEHGRKSKNNNPKFVYIHETKTFLSLSGTHNTSNRQGNTSDLQFINHTRQRPPPIYPFPLPPLPHIPGPLIPSPILPAFSLSVSLSTFLLYPPSLLLYPPSPSLHIPATLPKAQLTPPPLTFQS